MTRPPERKKREKKKAAGDKKPGLDREKRNQPFFRDDPPVKVY